MLSRDLNGTWKERVLHRFRGGSDGANPFASLAFDSQGNLYATTSAGGDGSGCFGGCGTVFKLTPALFGNWTESVLFPFTGFDGQDPVAGVVLDKLGNLYGTTVTAGGVFEVTP